MDISCPVSCFLEENVLLGDASFPRGVVTSELFGCFGFLHAETQVTLHNIRSYSYLSTLNHITHRILHTVRNRLTAGSANWLRYISRDTCMVRN